MNFPGDLERQCVPQVLASTGDLGLGNIFENHGVSGQIFVEMSALELETYHHCFPAQPALSALQGFNRRKCAHLLRDRATTIHLLPHCALFSQQLLDLTHRRWAERESMTASTLAMSTHWQPTTKISSTQRVFQIRGSPTGRLAHKYCSTLREAPAQQQTSLT